MIIDITVLVQQPFIHNWDLCGPKGCISRRTTEDDRISEVRPPSTPNPQHQCDSSSSTTHNADVTTFLVKAVRSLPCPYNNPQAHPSPDGVLDARHAGETQLAQDLETLIKGCRTNAPGVPSTEFILSWHAGEASELHVHHDVIQLDDCNAKVRNRLVFGHLGAEIRDHDTLHISLIPVLV